MPICHFKNIFTPITYLATTLYLETEVLLMSQVVREVLIRCASTMEERQAHATDVEQGGVSQDGVLASRVRVRQAGTPDNERLQKALVSLCRGYVTNTSLRKKFEDIASEICEEQGKSIEYFQSLLD